MEITAYERLALSFGTEVPDADNIGPALKRFAEQQHSTWMSAFQVVANNLEAHGGYLGKMKPVAINYAVAIQDSRDSFINAIISDTSMSPPFIIKVSTVDELVSSKPFAVFVALATEIFEWLQRSAAMRSKDPYPINIGGEDSIDFERTNYLIAKKTSLDPVVTKVLNLISELESEKVHLYKLSNRYTEEMSSAVKSFDNALKISAIEAESKWSGTFEAFRAAKDEEKRIKKPVDLWGAAAKNHRANFMRGVAGLLIAFLACALAVFFGLGPLMKNIGLIQPIGDKPESFTPASTLTLAALIALITAAGFILKIAGRLVTNSLTLAEDAEIRSALADTYLGLTAEEEGATTEMRDKARTVMLAALFRSLPGHQQEEIVAPTVLSLAQEMLSKKGAS